MLRLFENFEIFLFDLKERWKGKSDQNLIGISSLQLILIFLFKISIKKAPKKLELVEERRFQSDSGRFSPSTFLLNQIKKFQNFQKAVALCARGQDDNQLNKKIKNSRIEKNIIIV